MEINSLRHDEGKYMTEYLFYRGIGDLLQRSPEKEMRKRAFWAERKLDSEAPCKRTFGLSQQSRNNVTDLSPQLAAWEG